VTVLVILDGLADAPHPRLDGRTPLEAAATPHLDRLAAAGEVGRFAPTPPGATPGSDVGVPACLGLEAPRRPDRARLEALGRGVPVAPDAAVVRATCVHVSGPWGAPGTRLTAVADPHSTSAAVAALAPGLAAFGAGLHPDPAGRHLVVLPEAPDALPLPATLPPHDLRGLPVGAGGPLPCPELWTWIAGRLPGDLALWPWGMGDGLPVGETPFGCLIAGVDLVRGLGRALGLETPDVPGATGGPDTDLGAKARAALAALERHAAVAVHVEAPDLAAHRRDPRAKRDLIERIDRELIAPLAARPGRRLAVTADHGTASATGRHLDAPVPWLLAETGARPAAPGGFSERAVAAAPVLDRAAWRARLSARLSAVAVPC